MKILSPVAAVGVCGLAAIIADSRLSQRPLRDFSDIAPGIERFDANGNGRLDPDEVGNFIGSMRVGEEPTARELAHLKAIASVMASDSHENSKTTASNLNKALRQMSKDPHSTDLGKISITK